MVSCCWCGLRGRLWMGLQGETAGGNMVIHPAAAREKQPFFDIIISVITYEAIKQTSLPISSTAGLLSVPMPSGLYFAARFTLLPSFWFNLSPNSLFSSPHPPFTRDSRRGFNFSILIVSLPTLCMSNTYWHSRDQRYTPSRAYCAPTCFCRGVCVQGWWGYKMPITLRVWSLLHWRESSGA